MIEYGNTSKNPIIYRGDTTSYVAFSLDINSQSSRGYHHHNQTLDWAKMTVPIHIHTINVSHEKIRRLRVSQATIRRRQSQHEHCPEHGISEKIFWTGVQP